MPLEAIKAEGIDLDRDLVGISVREPGPAAPDIDPEDYYALLANSADFIVDRLNADVVFVPMERKDIQHSHAAAAHMRNPSRAEIVKRIYSPQQILDLLGYFEFAVGMRLHFLIFAALRNTPFTALPYASKVAGFIQDFGMKAPPLAEIGIGQLIAHIDRSWDTRGEIRAAIAARFPELKERALSTQQARAGVPEKSSPLAIRGLNFTLPASPKGAAGARSRAGERCPGARSGR